MGRNHTKPATAVVTGVGMVSSLGYDAAASCAAARSGIVRAQGGGFRYVSAEDHDLREAVGHPAGEVTLGFEGAGRLIAMAVAAVEDLVRSGTLERLDQRRAGLFVALPDAERVNSGRELLPDSAAAVAGAAGPGEDEEDDDDEAGDEGDEDEDADASEEEGEAEIDTSSSRAAAGRGRTATESKPEPPGERVCQGLLSITSLLIPPARCFHFYAGHSGFAQAVVSAAEALRRGTIQHAIVGGIDSLLDEPTLRWLAETRRLKTEDEPCGLQPGEAGVFFTLDLEETARQRKAPIRAMLAIAGEGVEEDSLLAGKPALGKGLSQAIVDLFSKFPELSAQPFWILSDHNGESYRAQEWGYTLARLGAEFPKLREASVWYPALSFGDTGAASGAVALALSLAAFSKSYHPAPSALILSSSDGIERSALMVKRA
jgi:3-oxoacyl-[acyl-carrier-protein] synthase-1